MQIFTSVTPTSLWLEDAGQGSQGVDFAEAAEVSCQVLAGQNKHSVLPVSTLYLPSAHSVQTSAVLAAWVIEYVPGPQAVHSEELDTSE